MRSNGWSCGFALALGAWSSVGCSRSAGEAAAAEPAWTADPRLVELVAPCPTLGHFSGDTSDMIPVLVEKLSNGQLEVIRNVREELAEAGDAAVGELDALIRRHETDPHGAPALRNALGVLRLSAASGARDVLRRCLAHPNEDIRAAAAAGLVEHAHAEDYDVLASLLPTCGHDVRGTLLSAMHTADPPRVARDLADWIEQRTNRDLWGSAARAAAKSAGPAAIELFADEIATIADREVRSFLLAALVNAGDESALEELRALLADGSRAHRTFALEAFEITGRWREIAPVLTDPDPVLCVRAASLLAPVAAEPWAAAALAGALRDTSGDVRQVALGALLGVGDEAAADVALALLGGGARELQMALIALRPNWEANPSLATRAFTLLRDRHAALEGFPLEERAHLLQALGEVPVREAGVLLIDLARRSPPGEFRKMSVHRWLAREAGNTAAGREVAREAWRGESDELRRLDLLEAATFGLDDPTRSFLMEVVQSERAGAWEILYAAERLARQGPSQEVAPLLKRVALRQDHAVVRPALDCLLWRWYG